MLERVVDPDERRHRAGLRLAEGDRDLLDPHLISTRFITSTGHGEPAMIPVRSEPRSNSANARMPELGDEHRGHPVEARAPLLMQAPRRRLGIERLGRIDDRRAAAGAGQVAHHHPEAVVQRHGHAHPVPLGVPQQLGQKWALLRMLWWVRVAPLGKPVVPLVYWMLIGSSKSSCSGRPRTSPGGRGPGQLLPLIGPEEDRSLQAAEVRAPRARPCRRSPSPGTPAAANRKRHPDWPSAYSSSLLR